MIVLVILATVLATFFVGSVFHEVAHALAADLVGLGVKEIQIGGGPLLLRAGLGRRSVEIRLFPGQGFVQSLRPATRWQRSRLFIFVAAGPACDLVLLFTLLSASREAPVTNPVDTAILVAICVQAYRALSNLWPQTIEVDGAPMANDGLQMLGLLFGKREAAAPPPRKEAIEQSVYDLVVKQYLLPAQSLPALPERSADVLDYIVGRYIRQQDLTPETMSRIDRAVSANMHACEQLMLLDAMITWMLPRTDPVSLAKLDRWSARAYELGPGIATVRGSRGAVLVEIGRAEEGLALLAEGLNGQDFNDCLVHAFRALGHFKCGDTVQAAGEFAAAKALFKHEQWQADDIRGIVERIGKTIGRDMRRPTTWSVEAARAAFKTQTSTRPAPRDRP